ncbi:hypothetical protein [uncultured Litoreibacter sp.]|uniref:hypothetical protein n=1 Tax=uncultured Litoreibacter sp. TaxID=1392394 RepID=UPI0026335A65|nr:hypothetical protein [uncultured Litoreibacter sp.]
MSKFLDRPRLYVDFNEMLTDKIVLLSKDDKKIDSEGTIVHLSEGLTVHVYMDDPNTDGKTDHLIADGICKRNIHSGWSRGGKWTCEVDHAGIRHLTDVP